MSIVKASDYDHNQIYAAVRRGIELVGGLETMVKPSNRVFVKINHPSPPSPSERGIVTHPAFVEAILELLKRVGAEIIVGDDIQCDDRDGFQVSGFRQMCERTGVRLVNLREAGFVETECNGHFLQKVYLSKIALEADVIINLPKLKTHSLTVFTGGVKNMYGTIPYGLRTKLHSEYANREGFCQVLTDVFSAIRPQLTIMDGIVAMEGEGPAAGNLRRLEVILASQDAVALDAVATKIIGLDPKDIYTTLFSNDRGLGVGTLQNIEVVGEPLANVTAIGFKHPASAANAVLEKMPGFLSRFLLDQVSVKPQVMKRLCTGCSQCEVVCPIDAISINDKKARINDDVCIQCMCCHEVCRFNAIVPKRSVAGRTIQTTSNVLRKLLKASA